MTISTRSLACQVFDNGIQAKAHGAGGVWYHWKGKGRNFPEDVATVVINIPFDCGDADDNGENWVESTWEVAEPSPNDSQWKLAGTQEKPTLSPSLHWIRVWHGHLKAGQLESC